MQNKIQERQDWLLIADGEPLSAKTLQKLAQDRQVMVLDGAYEGALQAGLKIAILLGDFDTIHPAALEKAKQSCIVVHAPDQNKSDLDKGLEYIDIQHPSSIVIAAGAGRRLQHTLHNLTALKRYHNTSRPLLLLTESERISYHENTVITISGSVGDSLGVLGFPSATVSSHGLQYEMHNYALQFEGQNSVLNALARKEVRIEMSGGVLLIFENTSHTNYPTRLACFDNWYE